MVFKELDQAFLPGEGKGADQDVVHHGERGSGCADAYGPDCDSGNSEAGRTLQSARGIAEVLAENVQLHGYGVHQDIWKNFEPKR
jgi:hypothetical protein